MNIVEATKLAIEQNKYIYDTFDPNVKIKPSRYMPFDIMLMHGEKGDRAHWWNPTGEDILSNGWELCD